MNCRTCIYLKKTNDFNPTGLSWKCELTSDIISEELEENLPEIIEKEDNCPLENQWYGACPCD